MMQLLVVCEIQQLNDVPSPRVIMLLWWQDLSGLMIPSVVSDMSPVAGKFNLAALVKGLSSEWTCVSPGSGLGMELITP